MITIKFKNGIIETMENESMENIKYILDNREYRLIDTLTEIDSAGLKRIFKVQSELNEKNLILIRETKIRGKVSLFYNNGTNIMYLNRKEYDYKEIIFNNCFI